MEGQESEQRSSQRRSDLELQQAAAGSGTSRRHNSGSENLSGGNDNAAFDIGEET